MHKINPGDPSSGWKEVIIWAMVAGAVGGLARLGMTTWMNRH